MSEFDREEQKALIKEALKEWLDEKFSAFGRWSFYSLASIGLAALFYFVLTINGWQLIK